MGLKKSHIAHAALDPIPKFTFATDTGFSNSMLATYRPVCTRNAWAPYTRSRYLYTKVASMIIRAE
jgi:hypothetical protein